MKVTSIAITNFRGIKYAEATGLRNIVIVAGQNGSGKSCIFDAIRLLKSAYGGYQHNEWQHFFGEFQIPINGNSNSIKNLFNVPNQDVFIKASFQLAQKEKEYLLLNAAELLEEGLWQTLFPEISPLNAHQRSLLSVQHRERQPEIKDTVKRELPLLIEEIGKAEISASMTIKPDGEVSTEESKLLKIIFSTYQPQKLGIIDYHGAQRHYGREAIQGLTVNFDQPIQQHSQYALYNYNSKYSNIKSEMAANYMRQIISEKADFEPQSGVTQSNLFESLQDLFATFFPDKTFIGPRPNSNGSISFPVKLADGSIHDLDELSSGEKEILYGYLRIRTSAPANSIILLDEPELHLNPRLIRGLPEFYRKHLGDTLGNQIWLVTHSDSLIREAVGNPNFNVFHMSPCSLVTNGGSQLKPLFVTKDLDVALTDLVGDLAAYKPGGKGLIFEGGGDADFDKTLVSELFPEETKGINLISGANKARVRQLHEILENAYNKGDLSTKFYAIVDKDFENIETVDKAVNRFSWNVYHIENYLLEPEIIKDTLNSLALKDNYDNRGVREQLTLAARRVVPDVLVQKMREFVNSQLISTINLGFDPQTKNVSEELHKAMTRSLDRFTSAANILSKTKLDLKKIEITTDLEDSFTDDRWIRELPGREILKQFVHLEKLPVNYDTFRNMIKNRMREKGFKPEGMKQIIEKICRD